MEMTTEQRNYFIRRLDEITADKLKAKASELYGPAGRPESPTWGAVFAAIKAGEITLKEGTENNTNAYLNPRDVVWPAMEAKRAELDAYTATLKAERQKALDAVMLDATATEALAGYEAL
jgi:hypothetical protein